MFVIFIMLSFGVRLLLLYSIASASRFISEPLHILSEEAHQKIYQMLPKFSFENKLSNDKQEILADEIDLDSPPISVVEESVLTNEILTSKSKNEIVTSNLEVPQKVEEVNDFHQNSHNAKPTKPTGYLPTESNTNIKSKIDTVDRTTFEPNTIQHWTEYWKNTAEILVASDSTTNSVTEEPSTSGSDVIDVTENGSAMEYTTSFFTDMELNDTFMEPLDMEIDVYSSTPVVQDLSTNVDEENHKFYKGITENYINDLEQGEKFSTTTIIPTENTDAVQETDETMATSEAATINTVNADEDVKEFGIVEHNSQNQEIEEEQPFSTTHETVTNVLKHYEHSHSVETISSHNTVHHSTSKENTSEENKMDNQPNDSSKEDENNSSSEIDSINEIKDHIKEHQRRRLKEQINKKSTGNRHQSSLKSNATTQHVSEINSFLSIIILIAAFTIFQ